MNESATETGWEKRNTMERHAGLYLTFRLKNSIFGVYILKVREIIAMQDITRVPRTQSFLAGVINLRGKVIPVISLRRILGLEEETATEETCVIVIESQSELTGVITDGVSEVLNIKASALEPPLAMGQSPEMNYLLGMGKTKDKVITLLDIDRILDIKDFSLAENAL